MKIVPKEFEPIKITVQTRHQSCQTNIAEIIKNYFESLGFKIADYAIDVDIDSPESKEAVELDCGEIMLVTYKDPRWATD